MKVPDNTTKYPTENPDFTLGWNGFSGFPEGNQDNGLIVDSARADWDAFGETLEVLLVDDGSGDQTWNLGMYRDSKIIGYRTYAMVSETYCSQKVGSRLSRKR